VRAHVGIANYTGTAARRRPSEDDRAAFVSSSCYYLAWHCGLPLLIAQTNHGAEFLFVAICPATDTVQRNDESSPQFGQGILDNKGLGSPGLVSPQLPRAFAVPTAYGDLAAASRCSPSGLFAPGKPSLPMVWFFNIVGLLDLVYANISTFKDHVDPTYLGVSYYLAASRRIEMTLSGPIGCAVFSERNHALHCVALYLAGEDVLEHRSLDRVPTGQLHLISLNLPL
jgi:hypothetical protein